MELKLATYNVCHCADFEQRRPDDPTYVKPVVIEKTAKILSNINADIVGLNEIYLKGEKEVYHNQTEKLASLAGYPYYASAAGKDYGWTTIGNGLLSKYPILDVRKIMLYVPSEEERDPNEDSWWEDRVLLVADIDVLGKRKRVIATHFGLQDSEQVRIVSMIEKILDEGEDTILMGDLNALPESKTLAPLYARLKSVAKETGNNEFTFATYQPEIQIDYIFVPKTMQIKKYTVHKEALTSDHRPISAVVEI